MNTSGKPSAIDATEHTLHEFKEIIRKVRECKTAAEEREFINKEKAQIRERFLVSILHADPLRSIDVFFRYNSKERKRLVRRMLGSFSTFTCLVTTLTSDKWNVSS